MTRFYWALCADNNEDMEMYDSFQELLDNIGYTSHDYRMKVLKDFEDLTHLKANISDFNCFMILKETDDSDYLSIVSVF